MSDSTPTTIALDTHLTVENLEAPLVELVNRNLDDMTDDQLIDHIAKLREVRQSPQTFKAKVNKAPRKNKIDISDLL